MSGLFEIHEQPLIADDPEEQNPGLLDRANDHRLVVPRFQREFVWNAERIRSLIFSIAQYWPAGSLLISEGTRNFACKPVKWVEWSSDEQEAGDDTGSFGEGDREAILDGQQRITALNMAYRDLAPKTHFYINLGAIQEAGALKDEHVIASTSKKKFEEQFPDPVAARVVPLPELVFHEQWIGWLGKVEDEEEKKSLTKTRSKHLSGLWAYRFPVQRISKKANLSLLTNIFVTINQQGVRLGVFDLMVALTWRNEKWSNSELQLSGPRDLRDEWYDAAGDGNQRVPTLKRLTNYRVTPETVLKVVKLLIEGPAADTNPEVTVDVSNSHLLEMDPDQVLKNFKRAYTAIDEALGILESKCKLIPETLAHENYLVPIAYVVACTGGLAGDEPKQQQIASWYWAATFSQIYGRGGTGSKIGPDAAALLAWVKDDAGQPDCLLEFWTHKGMFSPSDLHSPVDMNEHLLKAVLALEVHAGSRDWLNGEEITSQGRQIPEDSDKQKPKSVLESHHVFPKNHPVQGLTGSEYLEVPRLDQDDDTVDQEPLPGASAVPELILNRVLITAKANSEAGDNPPQQQLEKLRGYAREHHPDSDVDTNVGTYLVDFNALDASDCQAFLQERLNRVLAALENTIPRS